MTFGIVKRIFPSWQNALLAVLAAVLLILAFPDFEWWFTAWFALVPLMWAVERQKDSIVACFTIGWIFGTAFFFGTCWWLAYAPIHYAAIPWPIAYILIFIPCLISGIFPGIFAAILAVLLRRFRSRAFLAAPFVWVFTEFLRYWVTGNNWNAIGYSQASGFGKGVAEYGGVILLSGLVASFSASLLLLTKNLSGFRIDLVLPGRYSKHLSDADTVLARASLIGLIISSIGLLGVLAFAGFTELVTYVLPFGPGKDPKGEPSSVVAVQPNVPMSGVDSSKLDKLRQRQFDLAEAEIKKLRKTNNELPTTVILPESPMNFMYNDDREFQQFVRDFTARNNVSLLFNSAEPDPTNGKYFNSAVMVGPEGREVSQYDKIYLLPFGEAVPVPLESLVPAFVGNFSYGREYDLLPLGEARAGVMICFESHFGQLSREYVRSGADAIIEMTNDGYLGPTPVLRQHLANAVFRAVETNRPVLRVTNVGITAYINERGQILDPLPPYSEGTRVWSVSKSDGSQTFYVKYGDWFAWLCSVVTLGLMTLSLWKRPTES